MTLMRNDLRARHSDAPPPLARAVGDPGWRSPEPLDVVVVLPDLYAYIDLLVRGEDGGLVAYLTVPDGPDWTLLIDIAEAIAGVARAGCARGRVLVDGRPPTEAVVEVQPDPGGVGPVAVWLDGLDRPGSLSFTAETTVDIAVE